MKMPKNITALFKSTCILKAYHYMYWAGALYIYKEEHLIRKSTIKGFKLLTVVEYKFAQTKNAGPHRLPLNISGEFLFACNVNASLYSHGWGLAIRLLFMGDALCLFVECIEVLACGNVDLNSESLMTVNNLSSVFYSLLI